MELPPPHVLLQLDAIIVAQRESADDDADAAFDIESSATSLSEPVEDDSGGARTATSRFWGVTKTARRWKAQYCDADGKQRHIGYFDTQEAAAHAVNAAIRRAGLEGRRKTNPVVDGQLVPRALKARGHGPGYARNKRRRDEPAATPSPRSRRR